MGVNHIAVTVKDIEATHRFYTEAMGFDLVKVEINPQKLVLLANLDPLKPHPAELLMAPDAPAHVMGGNWDIPYPGMLFEDLDIYRSIRSHIVDLIGEPAADSRVSAHTLIEALENDSSCWVLHDPDFNVVYVDR